MRHKIDGEGIYLQRYEGNFAPLLFEAATESHGGEFSRWMPWCHENYTIAEAEKFVAESIKNWENQTEYDFAIFDAQTDEFVGGISLNLFNWHRGLTNLGYWIRTKYQNRGIAHNAAKLLSKTAFEDLKLNRIEITMAVENYISQKTAAKAGAAREGILRKLLSISGESHDAVMFSFVREDFQN